MPALDPLMTTHLDSIAVVLRTVTLLLGALITYDAWVAYRRTALSSLLLLSVGFGFVTLGSLLAGVVDQFVDLPLDLAVLVQSALTVVGLAVILLSLYRR